MITIPGDGQTSKCHSYYYNKIKRKQIISNVFQLDMYSNLIFLLLYTDWYFHIYIIKLQTLLFQIICCFVEDFNVYLR